MGLFGMITDGLAHGIVNVLNATDIRKLWKYFLEQKQFLRVHLNWDNVKEKIEEYPEVYYGALECAENNIKRIYDARCETGKMIISDIDFNKELDDLYTLYRRFMEIVGKDILSFKDYTSAIGVTPIR